MYNPDWYELIGIFFCYLLKYCDLYSLLRLLGLPKNNSNKSQKIEENPIKKKYRKIILSPFLTTLKDSQ
jgi:hypothetical protein